MTTNPPADDKKPTRVEQIITRLKNHPVIAVLVVIVIVVMGLAAFTNALTDIGDFIRAYFPNNASCQTSDSSFCYAAFGIQFPEGAWKEGATYGYSLEVRECEKDNFSGDMVTFTVQKGAMDAPFYLLKDGVFDTADRNAARPANASPTQKSYAVVLIPRSTADEVKKAQTTCKAFINFPKGPTLALDPSGQGLILSQAAFDPARLTILSAAVPIQIIPIKP
jgi:hypothetical protein